VSARIRGLEDAVGGALFTRGRLISLTALGESFLPYVRRALEVLSEGADAARLAQGGKRGRIRLAALGSLAGGLVGPALTEFVRAHPEVECTVKSGAHELVLELLLDGIVDIALITWPCRPALEPELQALLLFHEPVVLVAHPKHQLATRRKVTKNHLVQVGRPLLQLRWWQTHHPEIVRLGQLAGRTVEVPMETARHLVLSGVGVGFFTRTYVAEDLGRGELAEIEVSDLSPIFRDSALVRRIRAAPLSPAAARFVTALRTQAERLALLSARRAAIPSPARRKQRPSYV
jgi:DNA-binding transcriptional LysR family regulator